MIIKILKRCVVKSNTREGCIGIRSINVHVQPLRKPIIFAKLCVCLVPATMGVRRAKIALWPHGKKCYIIRYSVWDVPSLWGDANRNLCCYERSFQDVAVFELYAIHFVSLHMTKMTAWLWQRDQVCQKIIGVSHRTLGHSKKILVTHHRPRQEYWPHWKKFLFFFLDFSDFFALN